LHSEHHPFLFHHGSLFLHSENHLLFFFFPFHDGNSVLHSEDHQFYLFFNGSLSWISQSPALFLSSLFLSPQMKFVLVGYLIWVVDWLIVPSDANIVFVESPTAVGYSYSNTSSDYELFTDKLTGTEFLSFIPFTNTSNHSIPFIELHY
jgi:hypothetical protein